MTEGPPERLHFEILERQRLHDGFYAFDRLVIRHELFGGGWTPPLRRELLVQRDAVAVLPYDPVRDRVVLIEQFRVGAIDAEERPWLLEAVAGLREPGESPEEVARRELREEAGLVAGRLEFVGRYRSSPGGTSELVDVFVAEVQAPETGGIFGLAGEHEDIRTYIVDPADAFAAVAQGKIVAATAVVPLLWLQTHRPRLRQLWAGHPAP